MGVPKFYRYISERYPSLSEVVREYQIPEFDNLYLDMNGIIHNCSHPNDDDVHFRISEETIFKDIFRYIEFLFRMIKPRKVFFMAIDGVAPRAKMNQQRGRRFRSAKEAEDREREAVRKGEVLPNEKRFDSNCITPGTEFMDRLHQYLKYFVAHKITTDDLWRDVKVILSGHETPGEGEHKIMDFIRYEKSQPGYDPNTRHCLYGLDADLIMLGMCSHEPHFSLLREEVKYIRKGADKNKRDSNPEAITFHLLHLSLFREYIDHEFEVLKTTLPFEYNLENIIDDWVLMGFLVGNDFIPHIPHFHINKNSLLQLYETYKQVMPTLDGYLNEDGKLNLTRFQKYLNELTKIDIEHFNDTYADLKYFESKTGRKVVQRKLEDTSAFFGGAMGGSECQAIQPEKLMQNLQLEETEDNDEESDSEEVYKSSDTEDEDMFMQEFKSHKRDYYMSKLNYKTVDESVLKEQAYEYIRALQWNLHYYYNGCMSWGWFYPHHYAPYISDVNNFAEIDLNFEMGEPFKPFEQLLAVLPSASKELLPKAFESLVSSPNSQLIDYYPEDFETDQNEKQQSWEAVVLIPFIDEKRLLTAVQSLERNLSNDETRRNRHGPHLVFVYSQKATESLTSPNPAIFPDIAVNHSLCQLLDSTAFRIPIEEIHKGLCDGVRLDVYIRGFPTLGHVPHDAVLSKERVRVFESASMNENMMLVLKNQEEYNLEDVAYDYLNQTVFINWPHLLEAKVIKVSTDDFKYYMVDDTMVCKELEDKEYKETKIRINAGVKKYRERWGVVVLGQLKNKDEVYNGIVIHALPVTGRKYVTENDGKTTLEKQYSAQAILCPIETTVKDIDILEHQFSKFETFDQIFAEGTKCFPIDEPYYGSLGRVVECLSDDGLVKVQVFPQYEPDLSEVEDRIEEIIREKYMANHELANRLNMSRQLCSRMLGTIFIKAPEGEGQGRDRRDRRDRINIGLNLKFNAKNEEIPGFSIKRNETWYFSEKVYKQMNDYYKEFPFIFDNLAACIDNDNFTVDDLIPGEEKRKTLDRLVKWLRNLESAQEKRQKCNAEILDEFVVKEIEDIVHTHIVFPVKELRPVTEIYRPNQLYRPIHHMGYSLPDPRTRFELFDRVVNVRSGISVPLGAKGTIIGKHLDTNNEVNTLYDIVFDEGFVGGMRLRCSAGKGFKLSPANLINITFGLKLSGKYEQFISCGGQPLQTRAQNNYQSHRGRNNYNQRDQYNPRFNSGPAFGQRMPRPHLPHVPPFSTNSNAVNLQTSLSIQTLNHSTTSPFQSPKHETQNATMQQIWKAMVDNTNMLPKPPMPNVSSLPTDNQSTQPKQILENKSRTKNQKTVADNKRAENARQSAPQSKPKINAEFVETCRQLLVRYCLQIMNNPPKFDTVSFGPMNTKAISLTLPDGQNFRTAINLHPSIDEAYEVVSYDGLKHLNSRYNANIDLRRPPKLLSSPSFMFNQSSPNRPRVAESSLPRPPSRWIAQQRPIVPVFDRQPVIPDVADIPDSLVAHNNRLLQERQQRQFSRDNISPTNQARKNLFGNNGGSQNTNQNPRYRNNQNMPRDGNNGGQSASRRSYNPRQPATSHAAFENQTAFVPLQVARNNQSHRSPHKKDVEILTPVAVAQISNNSNDEIEILTPESLSNPSAANSSNRRRPRNRSSRLGVNLESI